MSGTQRCRRASRHHFLHPLLLRLRSTTSAARQRVRSRSRRIGGGGRKLGRTSPCAWVTVRTDAINPGRRARASSPTCTP